MHSKPIDTHALHGCDRLHCAVSRKLAYPRPTAQASEVNRRRRGCNEIYNNQERRKGSIALIFRNLHWSQALFAIAPDVFLRDSVRMAPVIGGVVVASEVGFMMACSRRDKRGDRGQGKLAGMRARGTITMIYRYETFQCLTLDFPVHQSACYPREMINNMERENEEKNRPSWRPRVMNPL